MYVPNPGTPMSVTQITGVSRVGLYITIGLDADSILVASLGSSASIRRTGNRGPLEDGTEVVITFTQHGQLRFVDTEGTGDLFVVDADSLASELPEIEDYGIDRFTKSILYDEKIGGTIHMALGAGYPQTGSKNISSLHCDMICEMRDGCHIWVDDELFYDSGEFKV